LWEDALRAAAAAAAACRPPGAALRRGGADMALAVLTVLPTLVFNAVGAATTAGALPQGGGACTSSRDCQLAGECTAGKCVCDPGWAGEVCSQLDLAPLTTEPAAWNSEYSPRSSWGGACTGVFLFSRGVARSSLV
jgi:hypothetical protein